MKTGIEIVMGRPGIGKTTYLALRARQAIKKGIKVYSNVPIAGCYKFSIKNDMMVYNVENALVVIDEAGKEFNAREFRKFTMKMYEFFTLHRHYKLRVVLAVQFWDRLDIVIRELVQKIYILKPCIINKWYVKIQEVGVDIRVDKEEHKIVEHFYEVHWLIGGVKYMKRSKAFCMFDTYHREPLPDKNYEIWTDYKEIVKKLRIGGIINRYKINRSMRNGKKGNSDNNQCEAFKEIKNIHDRERYSKA